MNTREILRNVEKMKEKEIESRARSLARKRLINHWLRVGYSKEEAQRMARELIPYVERKPITASE